MSFDSDHTVNAPDPAGGPLPSPPPMNRDLGVVEIRTPQDLLSFVPYLLRYQPHDVLVVVFAREDACVFCAVVDLPTPSQESQVWQALSDDHDHFGPDSVYLVAYCSAHLADAVSECARIAPAPVADVLRVRAGRWWRLGNDDDPAPAGTPLTAQDHVVVPMALAGVSVAASREDLAAGLQPAPVPVLERVQAELVSGTGEVWTPTDRYRALWSAHQARLEGPVALDEADAARLLRALSHAWVRDACLDWHDEATWWLWSDLIRLTPPRRVPTVAVLLAGAAYQRGNIPLARTAANHAFHADPDFPHTHAVLFGLYFGLPATEFTQLTHHIATAARHHLSAQSGRNTI